MDKIQTLLCGSLIAAVVLGFAGIAPAADRFAASEKEAAAQPIEITADRLVNHGDRNYAEFIGNVVATHGNFTIYSDRLEITYRGAVEGESTEGAGFDSIDKIEAVGRVKIESDNRRAESDRAAYRVQDDVVELVGENSFVTDGKNTLTGTRITWHRPTGRITVLGSPQHRVKAVFYSTQTLEPQPPDPDGNSEKSPSQ